MSKIGSAICPKHVVFVFNMSDRGILKLAFSRSAEPLVFRHTDRADSGRITIRIARGYLARQLTYACLHCTYEAYHYSCVGTADLYAVCEV
jgi:hypothetical protein